MAVVCANIQPSSSSSLMARCVLHVLHVDALCGALRITTLDACIGSRSYSPEV